MKPLTDQSFAPFARLMLSLALTILIVAGCAKEYRFFPPESEAGMACITKCQTPLLSCKIRADERDRAIFEQCTKIEPIKYQQCTTRAQADYTACLRYAKDADRKKCKLESCYERTCTHNPNYASCEADHRQCYRACGGQIREIE